MSAEDQRIRELIIERHPLGGWIDPELSDELSKVDQHNTEQLKQIIDEHGWPGKSLVGDDGAAAAWLLAQHADRDLVFQKRCLALLRKAVRAGEADPAHAAYLGDRIAVHDERHQTYGTQFEVQDGELVPSPIADADEVDERRRSVGLNSLAEAMNDMRRRHGERG